VHAQPKYKEDTPPPPPQSDGFLTLVFWDKNTEVLDLLELQILEMKLQHSVAGYALLDQKWSIDTHSELKHIQFN
jgi:hypothetical protein